MTCFGLALGAWAQNPPPAFKLTSPVFAPGQPLPPRYARTHENLSPELHISGVPPGTESLTLIVDDPDAPSGLFTHWLVWNIPPSTTLLTEGATPPGIQGQNTRGSTQYDGPSPPSGIHHYYFHLYALNTELTLPAGANRTVVVAAMHNHVLAQAQLMGTFSAGQ